MEVFTVSEVARILSRRTGQTVSPQCISNLFYKRLLDDDRCPVTGRCRLIPEEYLPEIEQALGRRGVLRSNPCRDPVQ